MNKIIFYTLILVLSITGKALSQTKTQIKINKKIKDITFEKQIEEIATAIEFIVFKEKNELKMKIDSLESNFENKQISVEELNAQKINQAELTAKNIETLVDAQRSKMDSLIQDKVDNESKDITFKVDTINGKRVITYFKTTDGRFYDVTALKYYKNEKEYQERKSKRTTSQFVFAMGLNNLVTQGENLENSDYRFWGSHFYEWGLTYNTRIFKNSNLLHFKYGLSVMYNNLRPTENRFFDKIGDQTVLLGNTNDPAQNSINIKESRLRNVYFVAPLHLEFDLSGSTTKNDKTYFRTHKSLRLGVGGYGGFRVKTKQIVHYDVDNKEVKQKTKDDYNASNLIYGLSAYLGYKETSLYLKYDINPLFKNNTIDQNNVSLCIRFDFN